MKYKDKIFIDLEKALDKHNVKSKKYYDDIISLIENTIEIPSLYNKGVKIGFKQSKKGMCLFYLKFNNFVWYPKWAELFNILRVVSAVEQRNCLVDYENRNSITNIVVERRFGKRRNPIQHSLFCPETPYKGE